MGTGVHGWKEASKILLAHEENESTLRRECRVPLGEHLRLSEGVRSRDEASQLLGIQHRLFCGLGRPLGSYDG